MKSRKIKDDETVLETITGNDCPTFGKMLKCDGMHVSLTALPLDKKIQVVFSDNLIERGLGEPVSNLAGFVNKTREAYRQAKKEKKIPAIPCKITSNNFFKTSTSNPIEKQNSKKSEKRYDVVYLENSHYNVDTETGFAVNENGEPLTDENGKEIAVCMKQENAYRNYKKYEKSVKTRLIPNKTLFISINTGFGTTAAEIKKGLSSFYENVKLKYGNTFSYLIKYETNERGDTWHSHNILGFYGQIPSGFIEWAYGYWDKKSRRKCGSIDIRVLKSDGEIINRWIYLNPLHPQKIKTLKFYPPKFHMFESSNGFIIRNDISARDAETAKGIIKEATGKNDDDILPARGIGYKIMKNENVMKTIFTYDFIISDDLRQVFWDILEYEMLRGNEYKIKPAGTGVNPTVTRISSFMQRMKKDTYNDIRKPHISMDEYLAMWYAKGERLFT